MTAKKHKFKDYSTVHFLNHESRIAWLESKFESIETSFKTIEKKFDAIDSRFDNLNQKIDSNFRWILGIMVSVGVAIVSLLHK